MRKKFDRVFQFKITLKRTKPPIWRRIHVPETYTFWDLHVAIQDVMGWLDCHPHHFEILNPSTSMQEEIGIPDEDMEWDRSILPGWKQKISDVFSMDHSKSDYIYDYGDHWEHTDATPFSFHPHPHPPPSRGRGYLIFTVLIFYLLSSLCYPLSSI
jgi:hypothetical protein